MNSFTTADPGLPSPQSRIGIRAFGIVILCMFINMIDGFDLFIIGFALPHLPAGFATDGQKGLIISLALVGMAVGAIGLARFADVVGRRAVGLAGILINIVGLGISALSVNAEMLMAARFITGVGVGMISVVIVVVAQESSPPSHRSLSTGLVMVGYPLGTTLAGLGSVSIVALVGENWHALFWLGAAASMIALVAAYLGIPESAAFRTRTTAPVAEPTQRTETAPALLGRELWVRTVLLCVGYTMLAAAFNFIGTWTPQLITDATGDKGTGATAGLIVGLGTLVGAITFAVLGLRYKASTMTWIFSSATIVSLLGFALLLPHASAYIFAAALGVAVFAAMCGYTAMIPLAYPVLARAKGYGTMLGVGRAGAIVAPAIAGFALSVITPSQLYLFTVIPLAVAAGTSALMVPALGRRRSAVSSEHVVPKSDSVPVLP